MLAIVNRAIAEPFRKGIKTVDPLCEIKVIDFFIENYPDPYLAGHPSLFFCMTPSGLIISPNVPVEWLSNLQLLAAGYWLLATGNSRHASRVTRHVSPAYNAVATSTYLIHRLEETDPLILRECHYLKKIPVKQSFTRSHLLALKNDHFITSDPGIAEVLQHHGLDVLYVSALEIRLTGHQNGGIGGAAAVFENVCFLFGKADLHPEGAKIWDYLELLGYRVVELTGEPLTDYGGIILL